MKKYLFAFTVFVSLCSCNKSEPAGIDPQLTSEVFRAEKTSWETVTKAGSDLNGADTRWEIGDEVTVFSESGECHNFKVVDCDGLTATFDCQDFPFKEGLKYKLFYPSLPDGWLADVFFVLTYNFVPENSAQKVGDWRCSGWVEPSGNNVLSFSLEHMNSLLDLTVTLPADGQLKRCYLRALPLDAGEAEVRKAGNYGFCYKDGYFYNGTDFERFRYNKMYEFNLVFDVDKEFTTGEIMKSLTPIDSDDYSGLNSLYLILVYTDGKVFSSEVSLPNMIKGNRYSLQAFEFQELPEVPFSDINWGSDNNGDEHNRLII